MIEQAIQMALQPAIIYYKMQDVFGKYEEGKLKGQKGRLMKGAMLQKALEGKLAAKLPQFKIFQGLDVSIGHRELPSSYSKLHYRMMTRKNSWMDCWNAQSVLMKLKK